MCTVFDASASENGSVSLNSYLEKRPNLLEIIPTLLTQFRFYRIGLIADICQAFLRSVYVKETFYISYGMKMGKKIRKGFTDIAEYPLV